MTRALAVWDESHWDLHPQDPSALGANKGIAGVICGLSLYHETEISVVC